MVNFADTVSFNMQVTTKHLRQFTSAPDICESWSTRWVGKVLEHGTRAWCNWWFGLVVWAEAHLPTSLSDGDGLLVNPRYVNSLCFQMYLLMTNTTATSVDVERTFSQGRLVLSHLRSRLSVQSTQALLCLGVWSKMGYVKVIDPNQQLYCLKLTERKMSWAMTGILWLSLGTSYNL